MIEVNEKIIQLIIFKNLIHKYELNLIEKSCYTNKTHLDTNRRCVDGRIKDQRDQTVPLQHVFAFLEIFGIRKPVSDYDRIPVVVHRSAVVMTHFDLHDRKSEK